MWKKGSRHTNKTRKRLSTIRMGYLNPNWKGGISKLKQYSKGIKCFDCGKLITNISKRCCKCRNKFFEGKNHPLFGKHLSQKTKLKISLSEKGKKVTEESKQKMSLSKRGSKSYLRKGGISSKPNYSKEYRNRPEVIKHRREYKKNKLLTDINFKLTHYLRSRINKVLKDKSKSASTMKLLGCSIEFFKGHLEKLFQPGMSWNNYSYYGWHIDHIRPCASFDLSKAKQQRKCFNWKNLSPMWMKENILKGTRRI